MENKKLTILFELGLPFRSRFRKISLVPGPSFLIWWDILQKIECCHICRCAELQKARNMKVAILQEMCSAARPSLDVIGNGNLIKVHQARSWWYNQNRPGSLAGLHIPDCRIAGSHIKDNLIKMHWEALRRITSSANNFSPADLRVIFSIHRESCFWNLVPEYHLNGTHLGASVCQLANEPI